jgi:hypothetical protein
VGVTIESYGKLESSVSVNYFYQYPFIYSSCCPKEEEKEEEKKQGMIII